jgi:predicted transcriptional regulator
MSTISLRLPESLHERLREIAQQENVSMNQFITLALAEKIAALSTEDYLLKRAARGDRVTDVEPFAEWFDSLDQFSDDFMEDRGQPAHQERSEIIDPILAELWDNDLDAAYDTIQEADSTSDELDNTTRETK